MAGPTWQEYQKEAKRLRIPLKSLLFHKKQILKKTKDGKPSPASIALPDKPEFWPTKAQSPIQIFTAEKKKTVDSVAAIHEMWKNSSPEDKAQYNAKALEQDNAYKEGMKELRNSDDGKKYFRALDVALRR